jgi:hypothetical protein
MATITTTVRNGVAEAAAHLVNPGPRIGGHGQTFPVDESGYGTPIHVRRTFKNTTGGTLPAGTIIDFGEIPRAVYEGLRIQCSALGASRTLDLGNGYLKAGVGNVFEGDIESLVNNLDVSAALSGAVLTLPLTGDADAGFDLRLATRETQHLLGRVDGGTIPNNGVISVLLLGRKVATGNGG